MSSEISFKNIIYLAVPAILSQAVVVLIALLDQLYVGHFGAVSIAAVSISNNIILAIYNFFEGIRTGTNILTAKYLGAKDDQNVSKILKISLFLAVFIGCAVAILAVFIRFNHFGYDLFDVMGNSQTKIVGQNYLLIITLGAPFVLIFFAITGFFQGLKDSLTPFYLTLGIVSFDLIFNYVFVYGALGYLKIGILGTAVSTLLTYVLGAICAYIFLIRKSLTKKYINFNLSVFSVKKEYVRLLVEIGIYAGLLMIAFLFFIRFFKNVDHASLASFHIILNLLIITYLPSMGFLVASATIVGKLVGEKREYLITNAAYKVGLLSLVFSICLSFIFLIFPSFIAHIFSPKDLAVQALTSKMLWLVALTNIFSSIYLVLRGVLTGVHDTRFIILEGLFSSYFVFLPLAYLLGIKLGWGIMGGYIAYFVWTLIDCFFFLWRFLCNKGWRKVIS